MWYGSDDDLTEDRAAFKPLEEGNDAYDKPRVSRVDMDERIQRLAKWYIAHISFGLPQPRPRLN